MWHAWERTGSKCTGFRWERQKERDHLEDQGVDKRMGSGEFGWGSVEWIQLAQDRGQWRTLVNMVMYLSVLAPWS
jgi:hypothetical protein